MKPPELRVLTNSTTACTTAESRSYSKTLTKSVTSRRTPSTGSILPLVVLTASHQVALEDIRQGRILRLTVLTNAVLLHP